MAKKKNASGSSKAFNAKEFLILHLEKFLFAIIVLLSVGLIAMGFGVKPYASQKTPKLLGDEATQASVKLKEDHVKEIFATDAPKQKDFPAAVEEGRKRVASNPIYIYPQSESSSSRRGDPKILAPRSLRASYYFGPLAAGTTPEKLKQLDKVGGLDDAKKAEERQRPPRTGRPSGGGSGGSGGGMGSGSGGGGEDEGGLSGGGGMGMGSGGMGMGSGGGGMGMGSGGMGMGASAGANGQRLLSPGYDRGFEMGMQTSVDSSSTGTPTAPDAKKVPYAISKGFVAVTALAPHGELEQNYKTELQEAAGYMEGRDTPNYVGLEVQRIELTADNVNRQIEEGDWQPLTKAGTEEYKKFAKNLIGTCSEIQKEDWTESHISLPIPPVLLNDYRSFASHPDIPSSTKEADELSTESDEEMDVAGGGLGGDGMGLGSGGMGLGSGGGGRGMGSGGGGRGMGSGGGGRGMGSGGMGGLAGGVGGGSSGPGMGSGGLGSGGMGLGSGGLTGGMGSGGFGGGMAGAVPAQLPKKLPSTKYKLVRFFDFDVKPGKIYKYRVRLLMYDPNFPDVKAAQPKSNTLKTETLIRVQQLIAQEKAERDKPSDAADGKARQPAKRVSKRETDWSAPSEPISTIRPAMLFARPETAGKNHEAVAVDYDPSYSAYVPLKSNPTATVRGFVFGTPKKERNKEGIEIVSPVSKAIKVHKEFKPTSMITLVDIMSSAPLAYSNAREPLTSGAEYAAFDPVTGQLIISREFDDFTGFNMQVHPDSPPVGPLGGGLREEQKSAEGSAGGLGGGLGSGGGSGGVGEGD